MSYLGDRGKEGEREGEKQWYERETSIGGLLYMPQPGTEPTAQVRVLTQIKRDTFCFSRWCPTHWATLVRADKYLYHSVYWVEFLRNRLRDKKLHAERLLGSSLRQYSQKEAKGTELDREEGPQPGGKEASDNAPGSSGAGVATQSCPTSRQGDQTSVSQDHLLLSWTTPGEGQNDG